MVESGATLNHSETTLVYAKNKFTTVEEGNGLVVEITAAETANYKAAETTVEITVAKAALTPVVTLEGWTYLETANKPVVTGNLEDGLVTYRYTGTTNAGANVDSAIAPTQAGSYNLAITVAETANYLAGSANVDFVVAKRQVYAPKLQGKDKIVTLEETTKKQITGFDENTMVVSSTSGDTAIVVNQGSAQMMGIGFGKFTVAISIKDTANYEWKNVNEQSALLVLTVEEQVEERAWVVGALGGMVAIELFLLIPLLRRRKRLNACASKKVYSIAPIWMLAFVPTWQIIAGAALAAICVILAVVEITIFVKDNKRAKALKNNKQPEEAAEVSAAQPATQEQPSVTVASMQSAGAEQEQTEDITQIVLVDYPEQNVEVVQSQEDDQEIGFVEIDGRKIVARYSFSFKAKLIQSSEEVQRRYCAIIDEASAAKKVKTPMSWKQVRIYAGRKTLALLTFRGKKLCMYFALDPKQYAETKYRGVDCSDSKSYAKTPMMLKLTSDRKLKYALYLWNQVLAENGIEKGKVVENMVILPYQSREELIQQGLVKVLAGEKPVDEIIREVEQKQQENQDLIEDQEVVEEQNQIVEENLDSPQEVVEEVVEQEKTGDEQQQVVVEQPVDDEVLLSEDNVAEEAIEEVAEEESVQESEENQQSALASLIREEITPHEAQIAIGNQVAATLIEGDSKSKTAVSKSCGATAKGTKVCKSVVNIDTLGTKFEANEVVTLQKMIQRKLVSKNTTHVKVLARGILNKPLVVEANDFTMDAVKMIVLTGGRVIKK